MKIKGVLEIALVTIAIVAFVAGVKVVAIGAELAAVGSGSAAGDAVESVACAIAGAGLMVMAGALFFAATDEE